MKSGDGGVRQRCWIAEVVSGNDGVKGNEKKVPTKGRLTCRGTLVLS